MSQLMEAILMFDGPADRDLATPELDKLGYGVELLLDQVDEHEGVVLTPTVWIRVTGPYEGSESDFFHAMGDLAEQFGGDCLEAGLQPAAAAVT